MHGTARRRWTSNRGEWVARVVAVLLAWAGLGGSMAVRGAEAGPEFAVPLPDGVRAAWDPESAWHDETPTRETVCLNGLWRWQPAEAKAGASAVPSDGWGYFKVPGAWPGITDYMQKDCQTVHRHPRWKEVRLRDLTAAWHEREFTVPNGWTGRRVALRFELLNSLAEVFVDGRRVGEARFPEGEIELTSAVRPGATHRLSVRVDAVPLQGVLLSYTDSASAREVKGSVARRGLCGDVFLVSTPAGPRVRDVRIATSVRKGELSLDVGLDGLRAEGRYVLKARARAWARARESGGEAREFVSRVFGKADLDERGSLKFAESWRPAALWDVGTPENRCALDLSLCDEDGRILDVAWPRRFGFREFRIEGRDFVLNGSRIHLSTVPLDNAQVGAAWATYEGARESLLRLRDFGINFVYTHHYDCLPGAHLALDEILRAADDTGMLVALSQPHFSHYDWRGADADRTNGYARHAEYHARVAGNHPSVVMYATSHNATGYNEDMNPDMIDGVQDARDEWANRNVRSARRAEALIARCDPDRIVYHHASGNLGPLHAINFYPNFVPIQELSDWFEHWATRGSKPAFLCEFGAPFTWDWTMYRGWFRGQREFGSARVPWEFCLAEWNAQFLGDRAFPASEPEKANLRWEARQFRAGNLWHRWDYPNQVGSTRFDERYPVFAMYLTDNWRAFRGWGVSVVSPWEHGHFWKLREGVDRRRRELKTDWDALQRPGFSPDYLDERYERVDTAYERTDWIETEASKALRRNNRPLLAFLGGAPERFTSKDHLFRAGETVGKTLIVINDSRRTTRVRAAWTVSLPGAGPGLSGERTFDVATGEQMRWPVEFGIPTTVEPGRYELRAEVRFDSGEVQTDDFPFDVLPAAREPGGGAARIAVFDPEGATATWMEGLGIRARRIEAKDALALDGAEILVLGRKALSLGGPAPDLSRVREGLRVIVFEQTAEALERRLGFRVAEYGLRQVFPRIPDHPVLAGLGAEQLRDWRGEATLLPSRLKYEMRPRHGPTVTWCDLPVTRLWRCGNRGNVASVLIEKPTCGDFRPLADGGFDLQYSPLLEYREGRGMVVFCQLDVTGRTASEPVGEDVARRLLEYVRTWTPKPSATARYTGDPAGLDRLRRQRFLVEVAEPDSRPALAQVLVVGPGGLSNPVGRDLAAAWRREGGRVVGIGLGPADLAGFAGMKAEVRTGEHLSTGFEARQAASVFAGIGPADVHLREPRDVSRWAPGAFLSAAGAEKPVQVFGDGVLAEAADGSVAVLQLAPWWFDGKASMNLKRTERRVTFATSRLLANAGVASSTPLLERFASLVAPGEKRWLAGLYLDEPEEWDDPYRFFRW